MMARFPDALVMAVVSLCLCSGASWARGTFSMGSVRYAGVSQGDRIAMGYGADGGYARAESGYQGQFGGPIDARPVRRVATVSPGHRKLVIAGRTYYYRDGEWLAATVVNGATVYAPAEPPADSIGYAPPGATAVVIRGVRYYKYGGEYFLPVKVRGERVDVVVDPGKE